MLRNRTLGQLGALRLGNMFWPVWLAASSLTLGMLCGKCSCWYYFLRMQLLCFRFIMKMAIRDGATWSTSTGTWKYCIIFIKCKKSCLRNESCLPRPSPPVRTRSWLNCSCEDLLFQIYYKLVGPMNFEWTRFFGPTFNWYTWDRLNYFFLPTQLDHRNMGRCSSYYYFLICSGNMGCWKETEAIHTSWFLDITNKTFSIFPSKAKLGLGD